MNLRLIQLYLIAMQKNNLHNKRYILKTNLPFACGCSSLSCFIASLAAPASLQAEVETCGLHQAISVEWVKQTMEYLWGVILEKKLEIHVSPNLLRLGEGGT